MRDAHKAGFFRNAIAGIRAIDWHRRDIRDAVVIFGLAMIVYGVADFYDLPPKLFQWSMDNSDYEIDDAIFVLFVMSIALVVFVVRRMLDLRKEISARRAAELAAQKLARHDPLTGLPNRRFFNERLGETLQASLANRNRMAVLMLDLDGFKAINDGHGHLIGDSALVEFADRIGKLAKPFLFARMGGDEFAIVLTNIASLDEPAALAQRILAETAKSFVVAETLTMMGVSIGIAVAPDNGIDADELVRRADLALYRAKSEGRSCTRFFEPVMDAHVERRTAIERNLRTAIAEHEIEVYYQPLVSLNGNEITGFEALARWNHPVLGSVPPDTFIAIAEESGLIQKLGDQLLAAACRDAVTWPSDITLAFNISPLQLRDPTFGLRVLHILGETGLSPTRLELEITESAIVGDHMLAQRLIDDLRASGVRIALDDFGTGYATMSQLLSFRLDKIKIDRSFVSQLGNREGSEVIIKAIIGLAQGLGLTTTAEGIESQTQLADLRADGCAEGQGYLFGKAIPASEVSAILHQSAMARSA